MIIVFIIKHIYCIAIVVSYDRAIISTYCNSYTRMTIFPESQIWRRLISDESFWPIIFLVIVGWDWEQYRRIDATPGIEKTYETVKPGWVMIGLGILLTNTLGIMIIGESLSTSQYKVTTQCFGHRSIV